MFNDFQDNINITSFFKGLNVSLQSQPMLFLNNQFPIFLDQKIACKLVVVIFANDLSSNDLRQVWKIFAVLHSINFLPTLSQAFFPNFCNNLVHHLQLRQLQPQTTYVRLLIGPFASQFSKQFLPKWTQPRQIIHTANKNLVKCQKILCLVSYSGARQAVISQTGVSL